MRATTNKTGWLIVSVAIIGLGHSADARGQLLERVLMPGPVIEGHAAYEDECSSCHQPFSRNLQRELCLDCHTEVAQDLDASLGFHGRSPVIPMLECAACHTEHEGRDADVVGLDEDTFDHGATDFALLGSHLGARCEGCHAETAVYFRDAESTCIGCHAEEEPHKGNLGETCGDCHSETAWADASFDHDTTDFPLTGNHSNADCGGCHRNEIYVETPTLCVACHRVDDFHAGRNGDACQDCHTPASWAEASFDHFEETGFALLDGHGGLACTACHAEQRFDQAPDPACSTCHRADDVHAGNNGAACDTCHTPTDWPSVSFEHALDAGFALNGAHAELTCTACHRGPVETSRPEPACNSCHWSNDVHGGQLGESCQDCHGESGWAESVRFDHDLTVFPLLGLHAAVSCEGCHAESSFRETASECVDCHRADDVHAQRLGLDCAMCHNPNDWLIWQFDHDEQTEFALEGAHGGLDCLACHNRPVTDSVALSTTCGDCHRGDDIHATGFGMDCGRCHTTDAFTELK
ncbi:MAG: cytochrome C [Gammaproteobacteria bacterium]|nr:cytochrome C [Gammaproteobacteria bacterium]